MGFKASQMWIPSTSPLLATDNYMIASYLCMLYACTSIFMESDAFISLSINDIIFTNYTLDVSFNLYKMAKAYFYP